MSKKIDRRNFMKILTASAGATVLVRCGPGGSPEKVTVIQTQEVIKEVTATSGPLEAVADVMGTFPRRETVIVRQLTGRVGTPDNMNLWVGWKWQDRGLQNLADEPLWSVDFATGKIINGLADGDAKYNADFTECTIPLRKGVTWNDGEAFTSADVVYTIETCKKFSGLNANSFFVDNVASVTAVDELHGQVCPE